MRIGENIAPDKPQFDSDKKYVYVHQDGTRMHCIPDSESVRWSQEEGSWMMKAKISGGSATGTFVVDCSLVKEA